MHILSFETLSTFLLWDVADNIGTYLLLHFPRLSPLVTTVSPLSVPNSSTSPLYSIIHPSISKLGWLFCLLSAHQLLVHWCLHSPFQTSSNMAYYMSAIVDKVTWWGELVWTRGTLHPPLHTPAPAHTHCWWRGDVSSSHTSRWSHTACSQELPLVKRFQWRAVFGPDNIYTRYRKVSPF